MYSYYTARYAVGAATHIGISIGAFHTRYIGYQNIS